jgi:hypothetical protein
MDGVAISGHAVCGEFCLCAGDAKDRRKVALGTMFNRNSWTSDSLKTSAETLSKTLNGTPSTSGTAAVPWGEVSATGGTIPVWADREQVTPIVELSRADAVPGHGHFCMSDTSGLCTTFVRSTTTVPAQATASAVCDDASM